MRYGIPYQGSKSRIAEWVVVQLPASQTLVDIFAGGCAVAHAAMLSGKWARVVANDLNDGPRVFLDAIDGKFADYDLVPTREEFDEIKDSDLATALIYSFGNNGRSYLWGRDIEDVKRHATRMLLPRTLTERRSEYRAFMRSLASFLESTERRCDEHALRELEGLQRLQRLQRLQGLVVPSKLDYRDVNVPDGATVYADPPYRGTDCSLYGGFDFAAFDAWLAETPFPVYVSEFTAPEGCVEVARRERTARMAATKTDRVTERLFVQERFAEEVRLGTAV